MALKFLNNGIFSGNITVGGKTYPKINLTDNQGVARNFSVGTNNETFTVRNETASSDALTISNANNATFAGDITLLEDLYASNQNLKFHAGGTHVMNIDVNGKVYPATHNAYDIGHSTSLAWRNIYSSGTIYGTNATFAGNVGIGTTSPTKELDVRDEARIWNGTNGIELSYSTSNTSGIIGSANSSGNLEFRTNMGAAAKMFIANGGNVGIGTTSPNEKLDVRGGLRWGSYGSTTSYTYSNMDGAGLYIETVGSTAALSDMRFQARAAGAGNYSYVKIKPSNQTIILGTNNSLGLTINSSNEGIFPNKVGIGTTAPTQKLHISGNMRLTGAFRDGLNSQGAANYVLTSTGSNSTRWVDASGSSIIGGPYLPLAGGTMTGDINFNDGIEARFGNSQDLTIQSVGDQGYIQNYTGNLNIVQNADDSDIVFKSDNGSGGTTEYFRLDGGSTMNVFSKPTWHGDGIKSFFGNSQDLQIYHDGTHSYLEDTGAGDLRIKTNGAAIALLAPSNEDMILAIPNSFVKLYFNGIERFATTAGGTINTGTIDSTGTITVTGANGNVGINTDTGKLLLGASYDLQIYHNSTDSVIENITGDLYITNKADDKDIVFRSDNGSGGYDTYMYLDGSITETRFTKPTRHDDGVIAKFGNGNDLNIYHNNSNSYINDTGTGDLYIQASDNMYFQTYGSGKRWITLTENAAVDLFYNDIHKLSTGIVGTGTATTAGGTLIDGWKTTTQANAVNNTTIATTAYVNNKIGLIPAGLRFEGTWDASTGNPPSASPENGQFWIVSVAGSTSLSGITDWKVGDWAIYVVAGSGTDGWQKVDNSSVLDGFGTGQSVTKWDGSGTSNTLTDGPITFSGNNSTFAGDLYIPNKIIHVGDENTWMQFETDVISLRTGGTDRLTLTNSLATLSEPLLIEGVLNYTGLTVKGTGAARPAITWSNANQGDLGIIYGTENNALVIATGTSGLTALTLDSSQNATFAGNITLPGEEANSFKIAFTGASASSGLSTVDQNGAGLYIGANSRVNNSGNVVYHNSALPSSGIYFDGWNGDDMEFYTGSSGNPTKRLTIEAGGDAIFTGSVGIGTTSPVAKLTIQGDNADFMVRSNDYTISRIIPRGNTAANWDKGLFSLMASNIENVRIDSAGSSWFNGGNVGIGTTTPAKKLEISSGTDGDGILLTGTGSFSDGESRNIEFSYSDTDTSYASAIKFVVVDASVHGGQIEFFTDAGPSSSASLGVLTRAMIIDPNQNVGIGTTSPDSKLDVTGGDITVNTSGVGFMNFKYGSVGSESTMGSIQTTGIDLKINATSDLLLLPGSNVGIGTTSPTGKLEIQRSQVTTQFDRDCFLRLHPTATTDSGGFTNIMFGTSPVNNFGVAIGGLRAGTDGTPSFSVRMLDDDVTGAEVLNVNSTGAIKFNAYSAGTLVTDANGNITVSSGGGAGGPYLPLSAGGTKPLVGDLYINSSLYFGGANERIYMNGGGSTSWRGVEVNSSGLWSWGETGIGNYFSKNVGIGTTSPKTSLDIVKDSDIWHLMVGGATKKLLIGGQAASGDVVLQAGAASTPNNAAVTTAYNLCLQRDGGNVGIGTASPQAALHVAGAFNTTAPTGNGVLMGLFNGSHGYIQLNGSSGGYIDFSTSGTDHKGRLLYDNTSNYMRFDTNGSEKMRIDSNGTVLINASTPRESASKLSVQGGMSEFETGSVFGNDWANSPISIAERGNIGSGSADNKYSPNLNFHWSGRVSNSLWMSANGHLNYGSYTSAGIPAVDGVFNTKNLYAQTLDLSGGTGGIPLYVRSSGTVSYAQFQTSSTGSNGTSDGLTVGVNGTTAYIWQREASGLHIGTNDTSRILINSSGNVGIGTTSPTQKLQVDGNTQLGRNGNNTAGDPQKTIISGQGIEDSGTGNFYGSYGFLELQANNNYTGSARRYAITNGLLANKFAIIRSDSNLATMQLGVGGAVPSGAVADFVMDNVGNVGIGTTSPNQGAHASPSKVVSTKASSSGGVAITELIGLANNDNDKVGVISFMSQAATSALADIRGLRHTSDTSGKLAFFTSGTERMLIDQSGNVGIGTTNPSATFSVANTTIINSNGTGAWGSSANYGFFTWDAGSVNAAIMKGQNGRNFHLGANNRNNDLTIKTTGDVGVGIGDAAPDSRLTVSSGTSNNVANFKSTDANAYIAIADNSSTNDLVNQIGVTGDNMWFATADVERMRITNAGNVGIGTTAPTAKLHVQGNSNFIGSINAYTGSTSNKYLQILQSGSLTYISTGTTNETIYFGIGPVANTTNISCTGTATATNFILSSDERLKKNIKDLEPKKIDIKWKSFELKLEPDYKRVGVIAQELEKTNPEFVREDVDGIKSVAYIDLLIAKIAELEARLEKAGI